MGSKPEEELISSMMPSGVDHNASAASSGVSPLKLISSMMPSGVDHTQSPIAFLAAVDRN